MPELPEVETTRRGIEPFLSGQQVRRVEVRQPQLRWPIPSTLAQLCQSPVSGVGRRGKYLLINNAQGSALVHLGMSGSLRIVTEPEPLRKHDHVIWHLDGDVQVRYHDPRRFGAMLWHEGQAVESEHPLLTKLGPEPLSDTFDADHLYRLSRHKRQAIKAFVMDSHVVVGVGNIYASESLFMSGIRPGNASHRLTRAGAERLCDNIKVVLSEAIAQGGTTLKDFINSSGEPGYFQQSLRVYGRADEPCHHCQTPIKSKVIGQRNSYYCPHCQA